MYYDAGAKGADDIDDDILMTARIIVTSNVNYNAAGTYTVRYNLTDTSAPTGDATGAGSASPNHRRAAQARHSADME